MSRKTREELKQIMETEGCTKLWSWSKINCFHTSPYEYFLKYVHKPRIEEDRTDCIYTITGSFVHDILEKLYSGEIRYEEMIDEYNDGWITAFDIAKLKFDRNDEEKNEKIANKYYADLEHFFRNHTLIDNKLQLEQFVKVKIDNHLFQGYIDACYKDSDGNYVIIDWKTSSIYKGAKAENECGQLILYAIALNQMGVPFEKIKICWNFAKYVSVQYPQKNGTIKNREIERCEIGDKLQSNVKMWLKAAGYEDEIDDYLKLLLDTNSIECLPEEVRSKYTISDCYVYVPITESLIERWTSYIKNTINDIEYRENEYEKTNNIKLFWDDSEQVEKESYYFATLCGYSPRLHLPYQEYLNKKAEEQENKNNIFANVGKETEDSSLKSRMEAYVSSDIEEDMSWLEEL